MAWAFTGPAENPPPHVIAGEVRVGSIELDGQPAQLSCIPGRRGQAWWFASHGRGAWSDFTTEEKRDLQREWLRSIRKENPGLLAAVGRSHRTIEGWAQGRAMPFAVVLRLALAAWGDRRHPAALTRRRRQA